jgi:hypothetical protein
MQQMQQPAVRGAEVQFLWEEGEMNLREAAQQALEALEIHSAIKHPQQRHYRDSAIEALRAALAEPQMQPCAGRNCGSTNPNLHSAECFEDYEKSTGMNQWQGLTDEEIFAALPHEPGDLDFACARAIEAALKEKNK